MITIISDFHFHNWTDFSSYVEFNKRNINSRLLDCIRVFHKIRELAKNKANILIHLGDLFETRFKLDVELFNLVYKLFSEKETASAFEEIYLLPGNHDLARKKPDILRSSLYSFDEIPHVSLIRKPCVKKIKGVSFFFCPFIDDKEQHIEALRSLRKLAKSKKGKKILATHVEIQNAKMGATKSKKGIPIKELGQKEFDYVLLGHFHQYQVIVGNIIYVGAPLQHSFGDIGQERGCLILNKKMKLERNIVESPKFYIADSLKEALSLDSDGNFVRYRPKDEKERNKVVSLLEKGTCKIQMLPVVKKNIDYDFEKQTLSAEELVTQWVEKVVDNVKDKKRLIDIGLKYLKEG